MSFVPSHCATRTANVAVVSKFSLQLFASVGTLFNCLNGSAMPWQMVVTFHALGSVDLF